MYDTLHPIQWLTVQIKLDHLSKKATLHAQLPIIFIVFLALSTVFKGFGILVECS